MTQAQLQTPSAAHPHVEVTHWREYFSFSTDHKVIGIHIWSPALCSILIGGSLG